eukprot:CAMPEP_0197415480 /NCGR_PEP_ID=MMETSP1170-20131217/2005_1 /TAXON_ID=54406 /ORGANISM="Sarcinochrysis sp, Strain CCMP770" /LENGTH=51 /DNA_ID=CAMNT_0042942285 /DNA_START=22 /DNA_END=173 /DNA_ORIENTATION=+
MGRDYLAPLAIPATVNAPVAGRPVQEANRHQPTLEGHWCPRECERLRHRPP